MTSENMTSNIFKKTAVTLAANGNIQEKYIELYAKAMEAVLAIVINFATALLIGYVCGMWWHCVILLAAFIPLRSYAGGYHAGSYISCYFASCGLLWIVLMIIKYIALKGNILVSIWQLFFMSIVVIFGLAPMADKNKPISDKESIVFKRRTRIILVAESAIVLTLAYLHSDYVYSVIFAIALSAFALAMQRVLGYMDEIHSQNEKSD